MTWASAWGERKLKVGVSGSVAAIVVPSQKRIANGRRGSAASSSRRRGAVFENAKTLGTSRLLAR